MKSLILALTITAIIAATAYASTCFLTGEMESGMNKLCFYDCLGSECAITVKSYQLCPLTINR